jgi:phosphatidylserine decarboxylase
MRNPFRLTTYGLGTLAGTGVILAAAGAALWIFVHPWAVAAPGALFAFCLWFFRDPDRALPEGEDLILSPADGTVADIEEVDEPDFVGGRAVRVGVFLSIFNCHVNRAPLGGKVRRVSYRPGKFLAAFNDRASAENESNFVGIETGRRLPSGGPLKVAVKQISGVIARRIVCGCRENDTIARGERFGMIKFGSRTELYLPPEAVAGLDVKVGDKVRGGATVIGRLKPGGA